MGKLRNGALKYLTYSCMVSKLDLSQGTFPPWPSYVHVGGVRGGTLNGSDICGRPKEEELSGEVGVEYRIIGHAHMSDVWKLHRDSHKLQDGVSIRVGCVAVDLPFGVQIPVSSVHKIAGG